jgi:hypothetical protein
MGSHNRPIASLGEEFRGIATANVAGIRAILHPSENNKNASRLGGGGASLELTRLCMTNSLIQGKIQGKSCFMGSIHWLVYENPHPKRPVANSSNHAYS